MADEQIQIQVNANTSQAQINIDGLDKTIKLLTEDIKKLNTAMESNVKATNQLADGMKTVKESVDKNTVSLGQLRGAIGAFGGEIGEAANSALMLGQNLINVAATMGPVGLAIAGIIATLELVKNAITDTQAGQDAWDGFIDNISYKLGQFKEVVFVFIRDFTKNFGAFTTVISDIQKLTGQDLRREWGGLTKEQQVIYDKLGNDFKAKAEYIARIKDKFEKENNKSTVDLLKDLSNDYDNFKKVMSDPTIEDHWKKIFEDNSALFEASAKALNAMERSFRLLSAETDIFTDRIADTVDIVASLDYNAESAAKAILKMRSAQGLYNKDLDNSQKSIDAYITSLQNEFELYFSKGSKVGKDQIKDLESVATLKTTNLNLDGEQQKYLEKLYNAYDKKYKLDRKAKELEKREERVEKQNQTRRIQQIKQISTETANANKDKRADNQLTVDTDIKGSQKEYDDKTKLISDEVKVFSDANEALEKEKIRQKRIDDELHSSAQERAKINDAIDKQEVDNKNKIANALLQQKNLDEKWRIQQIKNRYSQIEADDELAIINAKTNKQIYDAKVQLAKDEMTEKVKIMGLTDEQIANLSDKAQRDELIKQGVMTGEMAKAYDDYLLKVRGFKDREDKADEDNLKKQTDFLKEGIKTKLEEESKYVDWDLSKKEMYKQEVEKFAKDEEQIITDKYDKLIVEAGDNADLVLQLEQSKADQINLIELNLYEERHKLWDNWVDSQVKGYDTVLNAVDQWNQALQGSAEVTKGIQEAEAIINTLGAANKALNAKYSPEGTTDMIMRIAAVAGTLANGYIQVKKISETTIPGGGGGAAAALPSIPTAPNMFALGQGQIQNAPAFAAQRVYVTEHDITTTQQRVKTVESGAVLGG